MLMMVKVFNQSDSEFDTLGIIFDLSERCSLPRRSLQHFRVGFLVSTS